MLDVSGEGVLCLLLVFIGLVYGPLHAQFRVSRPRVTNLSASLVFKVCLFDVSSLGESALIE